MTTPLPRNMKSAKSRPSRLVLEVRKASRFVTVGIFNAGVDIALFAVLYYLAGWHLILAHVVAFTTAIAIGFFLNKLWTFRDRSRGGAAVLKGFAFAASSAISLAIATAAIWVAAQALPAIIAKVVSDLCAFTWTYVTARLLIFRRR
ncbi:MAG: GtrA family protein [Kiloniellales bacterium]|nr:GtrA family protein [Kiloniellales bacterium]